MSKWSAPLTIRSILWSITRRVAKDTTFSIKVLPSWRPDKAFNIELATFIDYMAKLGEVSDTDIRRFADLQTALEQTSGSLCRAWL